MPRLRVLAGPSPHSLKPICANTDKAHAIHSELFEGLVVVHVKGFPDAEGNVLESDYFDRADRQGVTWSIQVQGRFLQSYSADDILFGNTFDRQLKLPWGSGAALKFMHFIDPTLDHDLFGPEPWALSPLVSTMPYLKCTPVSRTTPPPLFPSKKSISDEDSTFDIRSSNNTKTKAPKQCLSSKSRRAHFSKAENRRALQLGPSDIVTTDFCYGFITFPELALSLPVGLTFDLAKYWDGQPVRFVCCARPPPGKTVAETNVFWCVSIERVDDD